MPELPEVESTRRELAPAVTGRQIIAVEHADPDRYQNTVWLVGRTVSGVDRRGKILIFRLDDAGLAPLDLVVHLKMTGAFRAPASGRFEAPPRFERVRVKFTDDREVSFTDPRRFGRWWVRPRGEYAGIDALPHLGPEPLGEAFDLAAFSALVGGRRAVKAGLLSQVWVAGLGNIYVDEALWRAGIHPLASRLSNGQAARLHAAIRSVLSQAVEAGGSTLRDARYTLPSGEPGGFAGRLMVYDRRNEPCLRCGSMIVKTRVAGRGTHWCPTCQPLDARG